MSDKKQQFTPETPWTSLYIIASLTFFAMVQFSIYFSSTYPFLLSLDSSVSEKFYGLVVASYSLGQIIGSPLMGFYSNKIKSVREPIALGLAISFIGNLVYASALLAPASISKYFVLAGRFIVGFGGSNVAVMRAFASMASSSKDRSRAIALINGGYALGQTIGPAIQLIFSPLGSQGIKLCGSLYLSIYTAPAFGSCIINLIALGCLYNFFQESYAGLVNTKKGSTTALPRYDLLAVCLCHLTTFSQRFTFTNLETLTPPLGMLMFNWTKEQVVRFVGLSHGITSFITLLVNIIYIRINMEKVLNFRIQCILSIGGLLLFHIITFNWQFLPGTLSSYTQAEYDIAISNGTEILGCNKDRFNWCDRTRPINVWVFYISYVVFVGTCFPIMQTTINTLFSKILGPRRMGTQQGILQMSGSLARLTGPVLISNVYSEFGVDWSWSLEFLVLGANMIAFIPLYSRLVPLNYENNLAAVKVHPIGEEKSRKPSITSLDSEKSSKSDNSAYQNTQRTNA